MLFWKWLHIAEIWHRKARFVRAETVVSHYRTALQCSRSVRLGALGRDSVVFRFSKAGKEEHEDTKDMKGSEGIMASVRRT